MRNPVEEWLTQLMAHVEETKAYTGRLNHMVTEAREEGQIHIADLEAVRRHLEALGRLNKASLGVVEEVERLVGAKVSP